MPSEGKRLRALFAEPGIVVAPGASDGLTARLIEETGFLAVYCTGGGISRGCGYPDVGYMTLTEMAERVRNMVEVCALPMIADIDSGFGNVLTLMRAVRTFVALGAAGVHVEDMEVPRRRAAAEDNIVPGEEMAGRVRAAVSAKTDADFVVIARTDVLPCHGLDAAIDRANLYAAAGADMVYVEFLKDRAAIETVAKGVAAPKVISLNKGANELVPAADLAAMGYKLLTHPADTQLAAIHAMRALLSHLKQHGSTAGFDAMASFAERDNLIGLADAREAESAYFVGRQNGCKT
jgi:2-methylisocitrate lyase-like PEP mutase family enzyme